MGGCTGGAGRMSEGEGVGTRYFFREPRFPPSHTSICSQEEFAQKTRTTVNYSVVCTYICGHENAENAEMRADWL